MLDVNCEAIEDVIRDITFEIIKEDNIEYADNQKEKIAQLVSENMREFMYQDSQYNGVKRAARMDMRNNITGDYHAKS